MKILFRFSCKRGQDVWNHKEDQKVKNIQQAGFPDGHPL
jgi:hypothetical protein